jgi:predicted phosphodiesterase
MTIMRKIFFILVLAVALIPSWTANPILADDPTPFTFAVTADMRNFSGEGSYDSSNYFRGAMAAIQALGGNAFMLSPGDIDPVDDVKWTIEQVMGTEYLWYPVVGNHELPGGGSESYYGANMALLRSYNYDQNGAGIPPDIVNTGPSGCPQTTYSFDFENAHFVVLNEYCDTGGDTVTSGDVPDHLYNWLVDDLQATGQKYIFVFGHEPAFPQPDADNGRLRHSTDSLNQYPGNRTRFWNLLRDEGVVAYFCGHTHNYSTYYYDGVWQVDVGHARGEGDTGAASTFLMIHVDSDTVTFDAYRDVHGGVYDYDDIIHSGALSPPPVFNSCNNADVDNDGDVDGADLSKLVADPDLLDISIFAAEFGGANCL